MIYTFLLRLANSKRSSSEEGSITNRIPNTKTEFADIIKDTTRVEDLVQFKHKKSSDRRFLVFVSFTPSKPMKALTFFCRFNRFWLVFKHRRRRILAVLKILQKGQPLPGFSRSQLACIRQKFKIKSIK